MKMPYSVFKGLYDNQPIMSEKPSWEALADHLQRSHRLLATIQKKDWTQCICPAVYETGALRRKANVIGWQWFAADIDNKIGDLNQTTMGDIAEKMVAENVSFVIYTTSKHTPVAHRFRLVFPLDRFVKASEFEDVWASVAHWLGCIDPQTKDESRLFIAPRTWNSQSEFYRYDGGKPLSVDLITLTNPVIRVHKPARAAHSAYFDTTGMKTPDASQVSLHGDFVSDAILLKACGAKEGERMFPLLVSVGMRALCKGYAISAEDLATIGREFATSIGRQTADIKHDAENAHAKAVSAYAQIKTESTEKLNPVLAQIARMKAKQKQALF